MRSQAASQTLTAQKILRRQYDGNHDITLDDGGDGDVELGGGTGADTLNDYGDIFAWAPGPCCGT
ncbi:MAG: hypothetical protein AAF580_04810 [Pseudomonadota bacterium]